MKSRLSNRSSGSSLRADDQRLTIGFAGIADFQNTRGQKVVKGVIQAVEDRNVHLINFTGAIKYSLHDDLDFIHHYIKTYRYLNGSNLDGLIVWASSLDEFLPEEEILALHRRGLNLPMVSLGTIRLPGVPGVLSRGQDGIVLLMDHLVRHHGYRRVGFVGSLSSPHSKVRFETYQKCLEDHDIPYDPAIVWFPDKPERKEVCLVVERLIHTFNLKNRSQIDALLTITDITANLLIEELQQRGFRVPEDVAVVGYNNDLLSMNTPVPITTVDLCFYEKGYQAVDLLIRRIAAPDDPRLQEHIFLPSTLVVRQSCGCYEDVVTNAGTSVESARQSGTVDPSLHSRVVQVLQPYAGQLSPDQIQHLASVLVTDLIGATQGALLNLIRKIFSESQDGSVERNEVWQQMISDLRTVVQAQTDRDESTRRVMEDQFHQARVLVSVFNSYVVFSKRSDAYKFHALARIAIDFAQAVSGKQIIDTIKLHLDELEMPGIYLVLQDSLTPDLGPGHLALAYPSFDQIAIEDASVTILPGRLPPPAFLPQGRRYSLMMEILYFQGWFMGYALIEMGPENVSLYDTVRVLLSHSLFAAYQREGRLGRERDTQVLIKREPIQNILNSPEARTERQGSFGPQTVIDYLIEHLHEPTDLDAMAEVMNMSKSNLIRKTKAATGHTVQDLHELLKIERAKILLDQRSVKVSVVSSRLGYSNQNYFSFVFKKVTGTSPRQWIRRNSS